MVHCNRKVGTDYDVDIMQESNSILIAPVAKEMLLYKISDNVFQLIC